MLEIQNLTAGYGELEVLQEVSLHIGPAEIVALIGPNGAGKSTTLRTISGLLKPQEGKVYFEGRDISGVKPHLIVQTGISQAPEGRGIFANLSVEDNLEMGAYTRHDTEEIKKDKTAWKK